MNDCYEGISVPALIEEPCGNTYISTNCATIPTQIIYLDLPVNSKQTEVNQKLVLALQVANQQIQDLIERVNILEGI